MLGELDALKNYLNRTEPENATSGPLGKVRRSSTSPQTAKAASDDPKIPAAGHMRAEKDVAQDGCVVSGFAELPGANSVMIADLAKELKGKLGCGGSFDRQEIVLQGDRAAAVNALLEELGFGSMA